MANRQATVKNAPMENPIVHSLNEPSIPPDSLEKSLLNCQSLLRPYQSLMDELLDEKLSKLEYE